MDTRRSQFQYIEGPACVADLGTKTLSKEDISKHCITLGYDNMAEEKVQDAQQDFVQVQMFETGGRTGSLQNKEGDHAKQQQQKHCATMGRR